MTFKFDVETSEGVKILSIGVDGFSHTSRFRRAYADCVHREHAVGGRCRFYNFMHQFEEPWEAVACLVVQIRAGMLCGDRLEHKRMDTPARAVWLSEKDSMPKVLFEPGFPR